MATAQDRITIYGPKDDCTYIVEFRAAEGDAANRGGSDPTLPGQDALWAGRFLM
jgi:hypothetical protein